MDGKLRVCSCRPIFSGSICNFWPKIKSDFGWSLTYFRWIEHTLRLTDMKVMALALMLDVEAKGGSDSHLKSEPRIKKTENFYKPAKEMTAKAASKIAGFYVAPDASENPLGIDGVDPSQDLSKGLEDSEDGHSSSR